MVLLYFWHSLQYYFIFVQFYQVVADVFFQCHLAQRHMKPFLWLHFVYNG